MSAGKVILGVLAGAAVGALFGVLFAPAKGAVTRRAISRKSGRQVDELKNKFDKVKEEVDDLVDEATSK